MKENCEGTVLNTAACGAHIPNQNDSLIPPLWIHLPANGSEGKKGREEANDGSTARAAADHVGHPAAVRGFWLQPSLPLAAVGIQEPGGLRSVTLPFRYKKADIFIKDYWNWHCTATG